jgi:plastocyanin
MRAMTNRTFRRSSLRFSIVGLAAVALAACGGSDGGGSSSDTVPADAGLVVDAGPGIKFDKSDYTATAGDVKIAYVNRDTQRHTLVVTDADKKTMGPEMEVGKSGAIDVSDFTLPAGTYQILCTAPGHEKMKATLTVE